MIGLQLGPVTPDAYPLARLAPLVEQYGFSSLWFGEHLLWRMATVDPLAACAYAAGATSTLRVGTSVLILPLHHPLRLAKTVSTMDLLAPGRLDLGVGLGGENPAEFAALGVPVAERGRRTDETIPLLRALWTGRPVIHNGRTTTLDGATLAPIPTTAPRIWVAGRSAQARARAVRLGDGWLPYLVTPEQVRSGVAELRAQRPDLRVAVHLFVSAGVDELARFLHTLYGLPAHTVPIDRALVGDPDAALARARTYLDAGADDLLLQPLGWDSRVPERVERLAEHLLAPLTRDQNPAEIQGATA